MSRDSKSTRRRILKATGSAATIGLAGCVGQSENDGTEGENYPSDTINLIVPYSEGGGTDTYTRAMAPWLEEELDTPIAVENIPGSAGMRGVGENLRDEPNGYRYCNILPPATGLLSAVLEEGEPPINMGDVNPICGYGVSVYVIYCNSDHGVETFDEMLEMYRSGEWEGFGVGSPASAPWTQAAVMRLNETNFEWSQLVTYGGSGPTNQAVARNEVPAGIATPEAASEFIEDGTFTPLVITSSRGSDSLPDVPTVPELGYENIDHVSELTRGFAAPPETPEDRTDAFCDALHAALESDAAQEWSEETGSDITLISKEEMRDSWFGILEDLPDQIDMEELRAFL